MCVDLHKGSPQLTITVPICTPVKMLAERGRSFGATRLAVGDARESPKELFARITVLFANNLKVRRISRRNDTEPCDASLERSSQL